MAKLFEESVIINCLKCQLPFKSKSKVYNRICPRCDTQNYTVDCTHSHLSNPRGSRVVHKQVEST